jgi:hypothetical protein
MVVEKRMEHGKSCSFLAHQTFGYFGQILFFDEKKLLPPFDKNFEEKQGATPFTAILLDAFRCVSPIAKINLF